MSTREQASLRERWQAYQDLETLHGHWYWRPGWRIGRSFYTWHLTFEDAPDLHKLVDQVQAVLDLPGLDLVPREGLHLTMQGVGFTDEVSDADIDAIVQAVTDQCRERRPFELTLGPVDPDAEGVGLLVTPWEPVEEIRHAIRRAITTVRGTVDEMEDGFRPHVTLAYSGYDAPATAIRSQLEHLRDRPPVATHVSQIQLIALNRDEKVYRWEVTATVPLTGTHGDT